LVLGASLQLAVPTGDYDASRLVNLGSNRWAARLELGLSKSLTPWLIELAVAGTFYAANDDFYGGRRRTQEPIYSFQAHAVRMLRAGYWLAIDGTFYSGGQTETNGVAGADRQDNSRIGLTLSVPLTGRQSLKLNASSGVSTRTGTDFDTLAAIWQYRW
jgi:hypothetical protein